MKKFIPILGIILAISISLLLISINPQEVISKEEALLPSSSSLIEYDNQLFEVTIGTTDVPSEDYPIISIEDMIIPLGTTQSVDVQIINATDIIIAGLNITWDPSVLHFVAVDNSTSDFNTSFVVYDAEKGYIKINSFYFNYTETDGYVGLNGNLTLCSLEFEPASEAVDGDWCWINTTNSNLYFWDSQVVWICNTVDNSVAEIEGYLDAYVELNHISIPVDDQGSVKLNASYNGQISTVGLNISWDPTIINLVLFDSSSGDFGSVLYNMSNDTGYLRVDAYAFSNQPSGDDILIGTLQFEPTISAQPGDMTELEFTESIMLDELAAPVMHSRYDGSIAITGNGCIGSVLGYVYNDLNENGIKDAGEQGLANWPVFLNDTQILTDSQGYYEFNSICPGPYSIHDTISTGWTNTSASLININVNQNTLTIGFGNIYTSPQQIYIEKSVRKACCNVYDSEGVIVYDDEEQWVIFKLEITGSGSYEFVNITDYLPDGLVFNLVYSSDHGWLIPSQMGSNLIWNLGNKEGNWAETIYFRCEIIADCNSIEYNTVEARGIQTCEEVDIVSDSAWVDVQCGQQEPAEIQVTKLVKENCDGPFVKQVDIPYDDYVTYKIRINILNSDVLSLHIRDTLPQLDGLVYNNSYILDSDGSYIFPSEYTFEITDEYLFWNFSYVTPGVIEIYYCADAIGCDEYENTVNVTAHVRSCCPEAWLYEEDSALVNIICPSGVRMDKKASLDGVTWTNGPIETILNDTIWFKLTVTNIGFEAVGGVNITDYLPYFLTLIEVVDDDHAVDKSSSNQSLAWFYGNINAQDSKVIIFKAKVIAIGTGYNVACAKDCLSSSAWCDEVEIIIEEGMHVEKLVSTDKTNWANNITVTTGDEVWWNITVSYYTSSDLVLYHIILNDTLPYNVTYIADSAILYHGDGWSKHVNPVINKSVLTWDLTPIEIPDQAVLQNNEWLSITFATTIGLETNGILENIVNVSARQCNKTYLFDQDSAFINVTEIINHAPTITGPRPKNNAENVSINPTLQVTVDDADDDFLTVIFYNASDHSVIRSYSAINPPENVTAAWSNLAYNMSYSWYVNASDGIKQVTSPIYTFETGEEPDNLPPDTPTNPSPGNGATNVDRNPWISVHVSDPDGDDMTVTFYDASDDNIIGTDTCTDDCTASVKWTNLEFSTSYNWYVTVSDGEFTVTSNVWRFTTESPDVDIDIGLTGGIGIRLDIENIGTDTATDVEWEMNVVSVSRLRNINASYGATIDDIEGGYQTYQKVSIFRFFARVEITAKVTCAESSPVELTKRAIIIGPFVILR